MCSFSRPSTLASNHLLSCFTCGKPALDEFLKSHALDKQNAMLSRTYVVTTGDSQVIAYYTLAFVAVSQSEAPKKMARGIPSTIPTMLLARLAVDERFHRQGIGRSLFRDAILRTWAVMKDGSAPVMFFAVDAKEEETKAFYEWLHMIPSPSDPTRLFLHYKDLRAIFDPEAQS